MWGEVERGKEGRCPYACVSEEGGGHRYGEQGGQRRQATDGREGVSTKPRGRRTGRGRREGGARNPERRGGGRARKPRRGEGGEDGREGGGGGLQ